MNISGLLELLDYVVIFAYLLAVLSLGFYVGYRQRGKTNILLAQKSLGWVSVGLSIWSTNVGPTFLIAAAGVAYTTGMVTANFEWLAWVFLMLCAMIFAPHYLGLDINTIPQIIKRRFGEATYRMLTAYVLYTIIMLWLGGALYSGGVLVAQIMGWSPVWSIIALIIIATSFTAIGGLAAVVVTDSFQTVLIIIGATTMTVIGLNEVGGLDALISQTPKDYWLLFRSADSDTFPWPAIVLGYPVLAIWFWCTDQTIVQRMFGARDLPTAQKGALLAGFLKILPPLIFTLPGILCFILFPGLDDPDAAFTTMVGNLLPVGMKGLIIAVLIAALVSTVDSGLNSFSTVFTLDVYEPIMRKGHEVTPQEIKYVGRVATVGAGVLATLWAIAMGGFAKDMFSLLQGVSSFLAPPMTALFLLTLLWRRTTSKGVIIGFLAGAAICQFVGYSSFTQRTWGLLDAWPHHLWLSFILLLITMGIMAVASILTRHSEEEEQLPTVRETNARLGLDSTRIWFGWGLLAVVMAMIYGVFQWYATSNGVASEVNKPVVEVYRGTTPVLDGRIAAGEYADATEIRGGPEWMAQFSPVEDPQDLSARIWLKHDGKRLYVAFDITDDVIYGHDIAAWLPNENASAHQLTREGFPWFGDGVELLVGASITGDEADEVNAAGNGGSWQMVAQTNKSRLGGIGAGGLLEGEPRSELDAWTNYQSWITNGDMQAVARVNSDPAKKGYVIEWQINFDPCLEVAPGRFWSPEQGIARVGLNIALSDLDSKPAGHGNRFNIHHENWWSGSRDKRSWLNQWGVMVLHPGSAAATPE